MKNTLYLLSGVLFVGQIYGCITTNDRPHKTFTSYQKVDRIYSAASCTGPNGEYRTTIRSESDGSFEFIQEFDYRDGKFHGVVTHDNRGFLLDAEGNKSDALSPETIEILRSHEFHKIQADPSYLFPGIVVGRRSADKVLTVDNLGNPVKLMIDTATQTLSGFEMRSPMDTSEIIQVLYQENVESPFGPLAKELIIIQGGKDRYEFYFDQLMINDIPIIF